MRCTRLNNVNIDFKNLDPLALEITKSYFSVNPKTVFKFPEEFTKNFLLTYCYISKELKKLMQNDSLIKSYFDNSNK